jgi:beta propeller repeat protein
MKFRIIFCLLFVFAVGATAWATVTVSEAFPICIAAGDQFDPAISGDTVVWYDGRNGNADIYGYDLSAHSEFPICTLASN